MADGFMENFSIYEKLDMLRDCFCVDDRVSYFVHGSDELRYLNCIKIINDAADVIHSQEEEIKRLRTQLDEAMLWR